MSALPQIITSVPVDVSTISVPLYLEIAAASAGALYGAITAVEKDFDIFGTVTLAIFTGLGGGIIRDLLIQRYGIFAFQEPSLIIACILAGLLVFYFRAAVHKINWAMFAMDTLTLGLFAVLGADKALHADMTILPVVMMGTITCVGGGLLRDLLVGETPMIFKRGTLYGIAGAVGATVYVALSDYLHVVKPLAGLVAVLFAVGLRLASVKLNWTTTSSRDFTYHVTRLPGKVLQRKPGRKL